MNKLNNDIISVIYTYIKPSYNDLTNLSNKRLVIARKSILNNSIKKAICPFCNNEYIYQYWKFHHLNKCNVFILE